MKRVEEENLLQVNIITKTMYIVLFQMVIELVLGIPVGNVFLNMYVKVASTSNFQYKAHLTMASLIISLGVTIGCSLIINMIVCRKVRKIDMVEALKSVE
ncbi:putative ABC transport system permease protein [Clostridium collagenovorans DSM 3089]|uniref:Putative ABC transport system permease protein n=1 Tax=Clostridium collagenovorans DSM 3089 TaxID=1121306 RepID=A0A1M5VBI3_9CLOT|nr:FtsX-like permease family protein [Clostridium collagenovorans]SHH72609.1 putative ABC transport system permease protein [Clostridium collagenovorans DSM 3089]